MTLSKSRYLIPVPFMGNVSYFLSLLLLLLLSSFASKYNPSNLYRWVAGLSNTGRNESKLILSIYTSFSSACKKKKNEPDMEFGELIAFIFHGHRIRNNLQSFFSAIIQEKKPICATVFSIVHNTFPFGLIMKKDENTHWSYGF